MGDTVLGTTRGGEKGGGGEEEGRGGLELKEKKHETEWNSLACDLVKGLLTALNYLHENEVLHCDLTLENILVHASGRLKLGDFGISRTTGTQQQEANQPGGHYDTATEIYVAGMVAFYVMSGGIHPVDADGNLDLSSMQDFVAVDLVETMLEVDSPSADTLLSHPYFWHDKTRCKFLANIGNLFEVETSHIRPITHLAHEIDDMADEVFPNHNDWIFVYVKMRMFLDGQYKTDMICLNSFDLPFYLESMCKLLRTIRNLTQHTQL
ncbi:Serine/threonine-protein kinase/endoribonuclease IRE2 [Lamellibrachia satsuma]|nr:Serine/threonine-protein kinase/endoribonuclease IRE2 [Lamellibrachia satsuma]